MGGRLFQQSPVLSRSQRLQKREANPEDHCVSDKKRPYLPKPLVLAEATQNRLASNII
ncbi:hypothetical protein F441_00022 [Phytophthora nicotianae CJ01A1]|uniref:Uncharacterized protein n=4 Tax=Phytophthora nicotianae TaxID=4792 RepID=W3A750_PHYNI|nr:hypothetical protein L915_00025 [Phytophthora nicotianae]ETL50778.1 hypothetical protein L916_00020 [Phytophthora nicotianae]ETO86439.1 hypothetical protein F444_00021 [Phytophthora nicotianae P1976]ETP27472.1 hypothetical protein F441_00022 [Phytophthora nicotianae CJ01A1]ETP55432.1 hypothetical protein F442_00020 [Phytophthora nicotianae P10297]